MSGSSKPAMDLAAIQRKRMEAAGVAAAPSGGPTPHPATDNEKIWHPVEKGEDEEPMVRLYEQRGNGFHLSAIIRKYTAARVQLKYGIQQVELEISKVYDALGLLRSLQYDVQQFNTTITQEKDSPSSGVEIQYACFRLGRQASAFGVRLPALVGEGEGEAKKPVEVPGLDSLIKYVEDYYRERIESARTNVATGVVDFDSLGEYFVPGKVLVDQGVGTGIMVPTLMKCRACYYSRGKSLFGIVSTFYVAMEVVVAAGDGKFIVVEAQFPQSEFAGTRSTNDSMDLFTVPSAAMLTELESRGQRYQEICGSGSGKTGSGVMVEYGAGTFLPTSKGSLKGGSSRAGSYSQASRSGGRMMVDTLAAWGRGVHCANRSGIASDVVVSSLHWWAQKRSQQKQKQQEGGEEPSTGAASSSDGETEILVLTGPLPSHLASMTWPVVPGFSLQARTWGVAMVHGLKAVQFNEAAFESLVMPPSRKTLIQALVTSHENMKSADLIAGKGEGSIFLLHGPPGVGKTLTAEAIAEMLHKPLYVVSMGELGTSPESLEERLQDILDLCIPWKALVLIDEAEMLLERRTKNDIIRNAMVCVMLRLLEYYSGILFLTTNRVESLDPAFQSRVTCALRYDALSMESRREIWDSFLKRLGVASAEIDTEQLARHELNGRQIKNTLQLAVSLAQHEGVALTQDHLQATIDITTSFLEATSSEHPLNDRFAS